QRGKCRMYFRPMFRNVTAVQSQPFLADAHRGVRIPVFKGALRSKGVLAQLRVELVVNAQYQQGCRVDAPPVVGAVLEARIGLRDSQSGLFRHAVPRLARGTLAGE